MGGWVVGFVVTVGIVVAGDVENSLAQRERIKKINNNKERIFKLRIKKLKF